MFKSLCPLFLGIFLIQFSLTASAMDTYYNGRLVNLAPDQFKALETMEKRLYRQTFDDKPTIDRIEQLEFDLYGNIQKGSAITRLNNLKVESMHHAIRGTSIPPSMMRNYQNKYLQNDKYEYHDDVGIIDGFVRLWFPDFYSELSKYRMYKESRGINDLYF